MNLSRRAALGGVSMAAVVALAGCAGMTGTQLTQRIVTDINLVAGGLAKTLPTITGMPAQYQPQVNKIVKDITLVQGLTKTISTSLTATAAKPVVTQIVQDVNAVISVGAALPLPPPISTILLAASVLLPVIEAGVGLPVMAAAPKTKMTRAQARAILAAAVKAP